ncbi:hypothetical protein BASA81_005555 [Batrachochytrium salamandrivorans]|nr:hypothetical protein BASA81_005555 [Batrachochytrium salamandrivorans]
MAPLVPPPPAITLEEAKAIESSILVQTAAAPGMLQRTKSRSLMSFILGTKGHAHAFTGKDFVDWAIASKHATDGEHAVKVGQALLDHRLAHHVTDDHEFGNSAEWEYVFVSQETPEAKRYHEILGKIISDQVLHQGKLELKTKGMFWGVGWQNCYGVLDNTAKPQRIDLYKSFSAASPPFLSLTIEDCMCNLVECLDCKTDWYCFNLNAMKPGQDKMQQITLCADHSKRQEGWLDALSTAGVRFEEEDMGSDLSKIVSLYELSSRRLNSKQVTQLSEFKGSVCLVVNVSSKCGLSPRDYPQLAQLYDKYHAQGFEVLGFPTNNFGNQEPGTEAEIEEFVKQFGVKFPMFQKIDVNGSEAHPVFRFLKGKLGGVLGSSIKWNFTKFLCDRNGVPIKRYGPATTPNSFEEDIQEMLRN